MILYLKMYDFQYRCMYGFMPNSHKKPLNGIYKRCQLTFSGKKKYVLHCETVHNETVSQITMIQCDSCEERFKAPTFYIMVIWAVKFKNEGHKISYIFYQKSILTVITYCILWVDIVLGHQKLGIILEKLMLAENVKSEKLNGLLNFYY